MSQPDTSSPARIARPRLSLIAVAAFWILVGEGLGELGLNSAATVALFVAVVLTLPCALIYKRNRAEGKLEPVNPSRAHVPWPLWAFAIYVIVSAIHERTVEGTQNALVYLSFIALVALASAWASAGSGLTLLRWIRAAAVLTAVGYLVTVVLYGPGNSVFFHSRMFGEVVWIGMLAAVPLAGRTRLGHFAPLLLLSADFLSLSRTSTAACAVLYLGVVAKGRKRWELLKVTVLAAMIGAAIVWLAMWYQPLRDRFTHNDNRGSVGGWEIGTTGRSEMWQITWESIKKSPWTGHGIGNSEQLMASLAGHPHNDYLRLWNDFGALGLGLWVLAMLMLGFGAWRRRRTAGNEGDWAIHQAALLGVIGLCLNVSTSNLLVYIYVMCPVAVVIGTSLGRANATDGHASEAWRPLRRRADRRNAGPQQLSPATRALSVRVPDSGHLERHERNNPKEPTLDLRGFFRLITRRWLSITLLALVGLGGSIAFSEVVTPKYEASSQIFVSTLDTADITELAQGSAFSQARVQSYADIVGSPGIAQAVIGRLGLDMTATQLVKHVTAEAKQNTVLIDITVTDTDAERSALIANTIADEAGRQIVTLETPPGKTAAPVHIGMSRVAMVPSRPYFPRPLIFSGIGLLLGMLVGVALSVLRETLDSTLRTTHVLGEATGLPVLGAVPYDKAAKDNPLAVTPGAFGARAEAFRMVRTNLQFAQVDRTPRVIVVTSPLPGEGKTNTAANLALSLAEAGRNTCLVDADLRNPCVAKTFGLIQDAGLTTVLIGQATAEEMLQQVGDGKLSVLTSGAIPPNPAEILASERMRSVLEDLAQDFDTVVVDSAPLLPVADTTGLATLVDGAILVVRAGHTPSDRVVAAVNAMRSVGAPILGCVLSMAQLKSQGYGYGYGYGRVADSNMARVPAAAVAGGAVAMGARGR